MGKRLEVGGLCTAGHLLQDGDWGWKVSRGTRYVTCLVCRRLSENEKRVPKPRGPRLGRKKSVTEKRRRQYRDELARDRRLHARLVAEYGEDYDRELLLTARQRKAENSPNAPWNALKPQAQDELDDFLSALEGGRTKCFGDTSFTDYDSPDETDPDFLLGVLMPTAEEAEAKCAGCLFRAGCGVWAQAEKPAWGIYDGIRWADSSPVETKEDK